MSRIQRIGQYLGRLDILMDHLITNLADCQPAISGFHHSQLLCLVEVIDYRSPLLSQRLQPDREKLVSNGVLQSAETACKRLDPFSESFIIGECGGSFDIQWPVEYTCSRKPQVLDFFADDSVQKGKALLMIIRHETV